MSILKELLEINEKELTCEEVWGCYDDEGNFHEVTDTLTEAAERAFKRMGKEIKRYYRCSGGPKDGMLVSNPSICAKRKDPKKVRTARKTARLKKNVRIRKTAISKRKSISRLVTKMNKRLQGN